MLTKRWGIFHRPLQCSLDKWSLICTVAAKLHNICIDNNIPYVPRYGPDVAKGDQWNVYLNEVRHDMEGNERGIGEAGSRRRTITDALKSQETRRPPHAMHNSESLNKLCCDIILHCRFSRL
jgi:hypothetical protein